MASRLDDSNLALLVSQGISDHSGSLSLNDRQIVELGFLSSLISVICCTSTLAVGVNLPAFCVVLKGTIKYNGADKEEYSDMYILQMVGRAGRP